MTDPLAPPDRTPWAFLTRKGKRFGGVIASTLPKKDVANFLAGFIADGYEVVTVFDRPEYLALLESLDVE